MESIRWLLAVAEVEVGEGCNPKMEGTQKLPECALNLLYNCAIILYSQFDEVFLTTRQQYEKLLSGELVF